MPYPIRREGGFFEATRWFVESGNAVIRFWLEENQALLDKGIAELSLSSSLQTEAEKLQGPRLFIGLRKKGSETKKEKMIRRALAHILPKSCDKYCGRKGGLSIGWTHLPLPVSKKFQTPVSHLSMTDLGFLNLRKKGMMPQKIPFSFERYSTPAF
jgi:hypothetical protein